MSPIVIREFAGSNPVSHPYDDYCAQIAKLVYLRAKAPISARFLINAGIAELV